MQRGDVRLHPFCLQQRPGQFLQRDIRLGLHNLDQKRPVRGELARSPRNATLRTRRQRRAGAPRSHQPNAVLALTPNTRPAARAE